MSLITLPPDANRGQHILVITHAVDGQGASADVVRTIVPKLGVPYMVLSASVEATAAATGTATVQLQDSAATPNVISSALDLVNAGAGRASFTISNAIEVGADETLDARIVTGATSSTSDLFIQVVLVLLPQS